MAGSLGTHVDAALLSGTHYAASISINPPDSELSDWWARYDLVVRNGWPITKAMSSWVLVDPQLLEAVFDDVPAVLLSFDISKVVHRLHLYGWALIPCTVSPEEFQARVVRWTSADSAAVKVTKLWRWERAVEARRNPLSTMYTMGAPAGRDEVWYSRKLVDHDVVGVTSYGLKGADAEYKRRRLPETLPSVLQAQPARAFIVYEKGTANELSDYLAGRPGATPAQREHLEARCKIESQLRGRRCAGCGEPLPVLRHAHGERSPKKRRPRSDQRTCPGSRCRVKALRIRQRTWNELAQGQLDAVWAAFDATSA